MDNRVVIIIIYRQSKSIAVEIIVRHDCIDSCMVLHHSYILVKTFSLKVLNKLPNPRPRYTCQFHSSQNLRVPGDNFCIIIF